MEPAVAWLGALRRLQRAFNRSHAGTRIPVLVQVAPRPSPRSQRPELAFIEREREVEIALQLAGAIAESTRVHWDEEAHTLVICAIARRSEAAADHAAAEETDEWYAEVPVSGDVDGARAEARLKDGTLRIVAPRVDSQPLSGLPLFAWHAQPCNWSIAPAT